MNIEQIAEICHNLNKAYCKSIGDDSQSIWEEAPDWQKDSAINQVKYHLSNLDSTPESSHENWLAQKEQEGWVYGPIKNPELKQHPCFVPYNELPTDQKAKDYIFSTTVKQLSKFLDKGDKYTHYNQVKLFMEKAKQDVPLKLKLIDKETAIFRAKLIYEEAVRELISLGLGVSIIIDDIDITNIDDSRITYVSDKDIDLLAVADGCADTHVVVTGTAIACGIDEVKIQELVNENNLDKFGPGHYISDGTDGNSAGKLIKPAGHKPPDIKGALNI